MRSVDLLRRVVQIDTTNPPGDEAPVAEIFRAEFDAAGLSTVIHKSPNGRANLIARLPGPRDQPALVLLSHSDVVAVEPSHWSHNPFGGDIDDGFMWGRGALDMKGIGVMHAEAAMRLARSGATPSREVIAVVVADEEAGGHEGAEWLLQEHPSELGFDDGRIPPEVLGEGGFGLEGVLDRPIMPIALGEKSAVWVQLHASGDPGHGSLPPTRQAPHNLARAVDAVAGFRRSRVHPVMQQQFEILARGASGARRVVFRSLAAPGGRSVARLLQRPLRARGAIAALLADTVTPTQLSAGYKHNVVPGEASAALDCRLLPGSDPADFAEWIRRKVGGYGVAVEILGRHDGPVSNKGPLYPLLEKTSDQAAPDAVLVPSLTPGITDIRYFRRAGATGYGWVPLVLTPELLGTIHGHDERVPVDAFELAVDAMSALVRTAAT